MTASEVREPVSVFQRTATRYMITTFMALFAAALVLAFVPRQVFQHESLVGVIDMITAHWPKLNADKVSPLRSNPDFAEKFVISYTLLAAITALMLAVSSLHLLIKAVREGVELKDFEISLKFVVSVVVLTMLMTWWCVMFPAPFMDSAGFSTKYPDWEMSLVYGALFFSLYWMCIASSVAAFLSVLFNSNRNNTKEDLR